MRISNPIRGIGGASRENSFVITDDAGVQIGEGGLEYRLLGKVLPQCPLDIEMTLEAHPAARDTLLGALTARAERIKLANRNAPGRLYTRCAIDDREKHDYFVSMGYDDYDGDELFVMAVPDMEKRRRNYKPVGTQFVDVNLRTRAAREKFLIDCKNFGCVEHAVEWLDLKMRNPVFMAREVYNGNDFVGLILVTGDQREAVLDIVGVEEKWRGIGVASALLDEALWMLRQQQVPYLVVRSIRRNAAAMRYFQKNGFEWVRTECYLLGQNI